MQVIYILWLRQIKRYLRSRSRIIGSLAQPLLFLVALGFGFGPVFQRAGGGNYLQFLTPGIISMSILFTAVFSGIEIIWDKQFGFLKETLVAPVPRWKIMLGRTLGGATVATLQGLVVLIMASLIGFEIKSYVNLPLALALMFLIALLFAALGVLIASFIEDMQGYQLIVNFLLMPTFFLSGALFPLSGLPKAIEFAAKINPLAYGVDGLRNVLVNGAHFGMSMDLFVLGSVALILLAVGSYLFSRIQI